MSTSLPKEYIGYEIEFFKKYPIEKKMPKKDVVDAQFKEFLDDSEELRLQFGGDPNLTIERKWEIVKSTKQTYNSIYSPNTVFLFLDMACTPEFLKKLAVDISYVPKSWLDQFYTIKCHVKLVNTLLAEVKKQNHLFPSNQHISETSKLLLQTIYKVINTKRGRAAFFETPLYPNDSVEGIINPRIFSEALVSMVNPNDLLSTSLAIELLSLSIVATSNPVYAYNALIKLEKTTYSQDIFSILFFYISPNQNIKISITLISFFGALLDNAENNPAVWLSIAHRLLSSGAYERLADIKTAKNPIIKKRASELEKILERSKAYIENSYGTVFADPLDITNSVSAILPTQIIPMEGYAQLIDPSTDIPLQIVDKAIAGVLRVFQEMVYLNNNTIDITKAVDVMRIIRTIITLNPSTQPIDAFQRAVLLVYSNTPLNLQTNDEISQEWLKSANFFAGEAFISSLVKSLFDLGDNVDETTAQTITMIGELYQKYIEKQMSGRPSNIKLGESIPGGVPPLSSPSGFTPGEGAPPPPPPPPPPTGGAPPPPPPPPPPPGGLPPPPPPPPPPGGLPPPPPPPGGGPAAPAAPAGPPKKPNPAPADKVRNLYWNKVPDAKAVKTLWKDIDDSKISVNKKLVASLFPLVEAKKIEPKKDSGPKQAVSVLDSNREKAVSILLSRLRMTPQAVAKAIETLDPKLSEDTVAAIVKVFPTADEVKKIEECKGTDLPPADAFFKSLISVKGYKQRADLMTLRSTAVASLKDIDGQLAGYLRGVDAIMKSKSLVTVLTIALRIGNVLNGGTRRGGAYGFKISSLDRLVETRSSDPSFTAMHFLLQTLEQNYPEALRLPDELRPAFAAERVEVDGLRVSFAPVKGSLAQISAAVERGDLGKTFESAAQSLTKETDGLVKSIAKNFDLIATKNQELMKLFLEVEPRKPAEVLADIVNFAAAFERTYSSILEKRAAEEKRKADEARGRGRAQIGALQRGVADELLGRIKSGALKTKN